AGLMLALGLRQHGYQVRLVQNRSAEEIRAGKVLSTQAVFKSARADERALGLDLWADAAPAVAGIRLQIAPPDGLGAKVVGFEGHFTGPSVSVDQRLKFPEFMRLLSERGGTIELRDVGVPDLERYAAESDLVVVAAGKGDVSKLFVRDPARSPFDQP